MLKSPVNEGGPAAAGWRDSSFARAARAHPDAALAAAALLAGIAGTAWMLLQTPNFLSGYDFVRMHSFYKAFYRQSLLSGRLPLWNPYVGLGRPFMADIETATLYPPNLLILAFGVPAGLALMVVLHQALAIFGGVKLGRCLGASPGAAWVLGAGIALSGPFSARLSVGIVEGYFTLTWLPALFWLGSRLQDGWDARLAAAFAAAVALAILAGQPPLLFVVLTGLAAFLALRHDWADDWARRRLGAAAGLAGAGALGAGLAAAALLPFIELVGQGNRPLNAPAFAVANGMPAPSWLSLLVPASPAFAPNWEYDVHCGLVPLLAALGGLLLWRERGARALIGMGLMGALLAAGDRAPFLGWAVRVLPGASALRIPSRYAILVAVALLGLAALSLSRRLPRPALVLLPAAAAGAAILAWLRPHLAAGAAGSAAWVPLHAAALAAAALLVGLWQARDRLPRAAAPVAALLGAFCAANWLWALSLQSPVYSSYGFRTSEESVHSQLMQRGLLADGAPPPRIAFSPSDLCENAGMTGGFSTYNSYVAPSLYRTWYYLYAAAGIPVSTTDFIRMPGGLGGAPALWGSMNLSGSLDRGTRTLSFAAATDPRAYVAFDAVRVPDFRAAEDRMAGGHDFHRAALLEPEAAPGFRPASGRPAAQAAVARFDPGRVVVTANSTAPGILVLAEAWYPGWTATVSGRPAPVFPVNGWMRGVEVPAGGSEVVFEYRSRTLAAGAAVSLASAAVLAALLLLGRRGRA
jgi:hypothetical protein